MTFRLVLLGFILTSNTDPIYGEKRKVAVILAPPLVYERKTVNGNTTYEGLIPDVLNDVTRRTGIQFSIIPIGNGVFGEGRNESWSKLQELIASQEAYLGAGPIPKTKSHIRGVHYTPVLIEHEGWSVLMKKPPYPAIHYYKEALTLFRPLDPSVWLSILATFIIVALLLTLNNLINPNEYRYLYKRDKIEKKDASYFGPFGSFLFAFSTLTWQGYERAPRSNGGRVLVMFWVAFVAVTLVAYVANLSAYLMTVGNKPVKRLEPKVNDLQDVMKNMRYGTLTGWPTLTTLATSENNSVSELANALQTKGDHVESLQEGIKRMEDKEDYALIVDSIVANHILKTYCNIMSVVSISSDIKWYAFATKHQRHQDFEEAVLEAEDNGKLAEMRMRWLSMPDNCSPKQDISDKGGVYFAPLNIYQFVGPLCLAGAGIILCLVVSIVEIFIYLLETKCFHKRDEVSMQSLRDETHSDNIDGLHYAPAEQMEPAPAPAQRAPEHWVCASVRQAPLAGSRGNASKEEMRRLHDNLQDIPDIDDI